MIENDTNEQYRPPTEKEIWFSVFMHCLNRLPNKDAGSESVKIAADRADEAVKRFKAIFP